MVKYRVIFPREVIKMRLVKVFVLSLFLLAGCSQLEPFLDRVDFPFPTDEKDDVSNDPREETNTPDDEISAEQELIQALPKDAKIDDWNLILVNPWKALPEDYELQLVAVDNEQQMDARIVDILNQWKQDASDAGHQLFLASGYRTVDRQKTNFNRRVDEYLAEGYSEEEAIAKTKEYLTEPGHSEHHTGLALDIVDESWINAGRRLEPEYDTQASQQWLVETMDDYGFILRYAKGKEEITGIQYEPWHFRYVGVENARFMKEHELVLEEFIELLEKRDSLSR